MSERLTFRQIAPKWERQLRKLPHGNSKAWKAMIDAITTRSQCVIAEPYGFSDKYHAYTISDLPSSCRKCAELGNAFSWYLQKKDRKALTKLKRDLSKHWNQAHLAQQQKESSKQV